VHTNSNTLSSITHLIIYKFNNKGASQQRIILQVASVYSVVSW